MDKRPLSNQSTPKKRLKKDGEPEVTEDTHQASTSRSSELKHQKAARRRKKSSRRRRHSTTSLQSSGSLPGESSRVPESSEDLISRPPDHILSITDIPETQEPQPSVSLPEESSDVPETSEDDDEISKLFDQKSSIPNIPEKQENPQETTETTERSVERNDDPQQRSASMPEESSGVPETSETDQISGQPDQKSSIPDIPETKETPQEISKTEECSVETRSDPTPVSMPEESSRVPETPENDDQVFKSQNQQSSSSNIPESQENPQESSKTVVHSVETRSERVPSISRPAEGSSISEPGTNTGAATSTGGSVILPHNVYACRSQDRYVMRRVKCTPSKRYTKYIFDLYDLTNKNKIWTVSIAAPFLEGSATRRHETLRLMQWIRVVMNHIDNEMVNEAKFEIDYFEYMEISTLAEDPVSAEERRKLLYGAYCIGFMYDNVPRDQIDALIDPALLPKVKKEIPEPSGEDGQLPQTSEDANMASQETEQQQSDGNPSVDQPTAMHQTIPRESTPAPIPDDLRTTEEEHVTSAPIQSSPTPGRPTTSDVGIQESPQTSESTFAESALQSAADQQSLPQWSTSECPSIDLKRSFEDLNISKKTSEHAQDTQRSEETTAHAAPSEIQQPMPSCSNTTITEGGRPKSKAITGMRIPLDEDALQQRRNQNAGGYVPSIPYVMVLKRVGYTDSELDDILAPPVMERRIWVEYYNETRGDLWYFPETPIRIKLLRLEDLEPEDRLKIQYPDRYLRIRKSDSDSETEATVKLERPESPGEGEPVSDTMTDRAMLQSTGDAEMAYPEREQQLSAGDISVGQSTAIEGQRESTPAPIPDDLRPTEDDHDQSALTQMSPTLFPPTTSDVGIQVSLTESTLYSAADQESLPQMSSSECPSIDLKRSFEEMNISKKTSEHAEDKQRDEEPTAHPAPSEIQQQLPAGEPHSPQLDEVEAIFSSLNVGIPPDCSPDDPVHQIISGVLKLPSGSLKLTLTNALVQWINQNKAGQNSNPDTSTINTDTSIGSAHGQPNTSLEPRCQEQEQPESSTHQSPSQEAVRIIEPEIQESKPSTSRESISRQDNTTPIAGQSMTPVRSTPHEEESVSSDESKDDIAEALSSVEKFLEHIKPSESRRQRVPSGKSTGSIIQRRSSPRSPQKNVFRQVPSTVPQKRVGSSEESESDDLAPPQKRFIKYGNLWKPRNVDKTKSRRRSGKRSAVKYGASTQEPQPGPSNISDSSSDGSSHQPLSMIFRRGPQPDTWQPLIPAMPRIDEGEPSYQVTRRSQSSRRSRPYEDDQTYHPGQRFVSNPYQGQQTSPRGGRRGRRGRRGRGGRRSRDRRGDTEGQRGSGEYGGQ